MVAQVGPVNSKWEDYRKTVISKLPNVGGLDEILYEGLFYAGAAAVIAAAGEMVDGGAARDEVLAYLHEAAEDVKEHARRVDRFVKEMGRESARKNPSKGRRKIE